MSNLRWKQGAGRRGDTETGRWGDGETGRWGDGETGRRGDGETGRWGDGRWGDAETRSTIRLQRVQRVHGPTQRFRVSPSPRLPSPRLRVPASPHLPISPSPRLPVPGPALRAATLCYNSGSIAQGSFTDSAFFPGRSCRPRKRNAQANKRREIAEQHSRITHGVRFSPLAPIPL